MSHLNTTLVVALIFGGLGAAPAMAADSAITCMAPVLQVSTGYEAVVASKSATPVFTIHCSGGSSAQPISDFAYKVGLNTTVSQMLVNLSASHTLEPGEASMTIYANLSDTSGTAWGCGATNCRVIDGLSGN